MDRRNFLATGAVSTAGMLFFPGNLLAESAKEANKQRLTQPLPFKKMANGKNLNFTSISRYTNPPRVLNITPWPLTI